MLTCEQHPPVASRDALEEYRGFRHVARNIYTFSLNPAKIECLVLGTRGHFTQIKAEILAFADFLESSALRTDEPKTGEGKVSTAN